MKSIPMKFSAYSPAYIILFALIFCGCVMQQDVMTLNSRLERLEQRNATLEDDTTALKSRLDEYDQKNQEFRDQFAGQNAKVDTLGDELQMVRGRLEEAEHLAQRKMSAPDGREPDLERVERLAGSNKDRIARLEQYLNVEPSEKPDTKKISEDGSEKALSENEIYATAKSEFDRGNYKAAREGFQTFLERFPDSKNVDNAQFWIGEIYYREKWYEKAILEYQKVIEKHPEGNKMQAALLKQGFAFYNLGDKANARLILKELIKKFPQSTEAEIARKKLEGFPP